MSDDESEREFFKRASDNGERPEPPCPLSEMLAEISPSRQDAYEGPSAYTARELGDARGVMPQTATYWAEKQVKKGEWVRVWVDRVDVAGRTQRRMAWVLKEIYDQWNADVERERHE